MDVTPLIRKGQQVIQSYAGGRFRISGQVYEGAVFVYPDEVCAWPEVSTPHYLKTQDFSALIDRAQDVDVVLLGCGSGIHFLDTELRAALRAKGLVIDVMDTAAACRTYNVLMAEGRRVVAALLPVVID
jgi:uncharacterized protein